MIEKQVDPINTVDDKKKLHAKIKSVKLTVDHDRKTGRPNQHSWW